MAFQSNVINSQPRVSVTQYTVSSGLMDWSSNVCDCCDDCGICKYLCKQAEMNKHCQMNSNVTKCLSPPGLCATFIPCILGCKVAQDNGDSCCLPFLPGAMIALRTSIRSRYNIEVSVWQMSKHRLDHNNNDTVHVYTQKMTLLCCNYENGQ